MTTKTKRMPATAQIQNLFSQNPEMLKDIVKEALEEILEKEMSEALGAERAERIESRLGYRSGHYTRGLVTRIGKLELRVPRDHATARSCFAVIFAAVYSGLVQTFGHAVEDRRISIGQYGALLGQ